jgi:CelD/BcsL family acetyltransferase involved in cellulose biosynthesis
MSYSLPAARELTDTQTQALEGAPASATLSLVTSLAALRDLADKWRDLEVNTMQTTSVFQSFDWTVAWAETYAIANSGKSLHILAGYDDNELVFVWPLMRVSRFGISILTWMTDPFGQYGDVLVRKSHCPKQWINGATSFLKRLRDVDILRLRHVRDDSHVADFAKSKLFDGRMTEMAPYLDLSQFQNEEAYDARYTSVQRKRRKKIKKGLEEMGAVSYARLPNGVLADKAMKQAIDEKNQWLAERGRMNRVLGCPGHLEFLKALSRRFGGSVEVIVSELKAGNTPVSWEVGFRYGGRHFAYITSHVNALTDYSPGRLHMDLSQRDALKNGMTAFDLMVPNDAHKESWSSHKVATNDYYLPLSLKGAVFGHGFIRTVRPILRHIYYKIAASGLSNLNPFVAKAKKPSGPKET